MQKALLAFPAAGLFYGWLFTVGPARQFSLRAR